MTECIPSSEMTFKARITEDGQAQAGGLTLFRVDSATGSLVFEDRYRRRQWARGTEDVPVDVCALLDLLLLYLMGRYEGE